MIAYYNFIFIIADITIESILAQKPRKIEFILQILSININYRSSLINH